MRMSNGSCSSLQGPRMLALVCPDSIAFHPRIAVQTPELRTRLGCTCQAAVAVSQLQLQLAHADTARSGFSHLVM